ncbi:MAG: ATP-binding protein [Rhabdochlamydiaceae bacterium]|jgi:AAA+ ATPase superfamily predicted ATPase
MTKFIGREEEMCKLELLLKKKSASLAVIHGRRRIGKSRLAEEFGSKHRFISLSGLPITRKTTAQDQRNEFVRQLSTKYGVPKIQSDDWGNLFWILSNITQSGRVIILLDEISWMAHKDDTFLGKLKITWDQHFSKNPELILILCGSVSSWIEENILSSTGFLGRISLDLVLRELSLSECRKFWPKRIAPYEVLKVLSITGGVPKYLEEIMPELSAENNIRNLCFTSEGLLFREFGQIFSDLFKKRAKHYQEILQTLANGAQDLDSICQKLSIEKGGSVSKDLQHLHQAGFIQIDSTWNLKEKITSRLKVFRLSDNYVRFYLKYIFPKREQIEDKTMQLQTVESLPGWYGTLGLQFENLILANKLTLFAKLGIPCDSIIHSGPFFQRKTKVLEGCQIDLLIQTKTKILYLCEIKFSESLIGASIIKEVEDKIKRLTVPRLYSIRPVLIHVNGVSDAVKNSELFDHIIDLQTML